MDYKKLTIFNYQIAYYFVRLFTFYWIWEQLQYFKIYSQRPPIFYNPVLWIQKILFAEYPSLQKFAILCGALCVVLIVSLLKQKYWLNFLIFVLVFIINIPIAGYSGVGHHSHVLVLFYFLSIFLLPKNLESKDYKQVQFLNLGILITYSFAGIWKLLSMIKDFITQNPDISWLEKNAAKYNSLYNFYIMDEKLPDWMAYSYSFENLWVFITVIGIVFQALCFLGAFNRNYLTFTILFLLAFHYYTKIFVIADWKSIKFGLIFMFFPYHWFYQFFKNRKWLNTI